MAKYIIYLWLNLKCNSLEVLSAGLHGAVSCRQSATNLSSEHSCFQRLFFWSDRIRNVSTWSNERRRLRPDGNVRAESCDHVTAHTAHVVLADPEVESPHKTMAMYIPDTFDPPAKSKLVIANTRSILQSFGKHLHYSKDRWIKSCVFINPANKHCCGHEVSSTCAEKALHSLLRHSLHWLQLFHEQ